MKLDAIVPFDQFMAWALHDPDRGYYARRISDIGGRGDFTTAPMLTDAPARAIAAWAAAAMKETGCRNLIEIGPGNGTLANAVRQLLPWSVRWNLRLHLVETSAPLISRQKEQLDRRATWHRHVSDALESCGGHAILFSNELVDAFPVRRFCKTTAGWQEIAVRFERNQVCEELLLAPATLPDSSGFQDSHPLGQIIEVHDAYRSYLSEWMPHWKSGKMLTIDYGSTAESIYHRRPRGTLRAYLLQQRLEGFAVYENPGRQDITSDVNFTDLQSWSAPWVNSQHLMTFGEFLKLPNGHPFAEPHSAGEAFRVLEQSRQ